MILANQKLREIEQHDPSSVWWKHGPSSTAQSTSSRWKFEHIKQFVQRIISANRLSRSSS